MLEFVSKRVKGIKRGSRYLSQGGSHRKRTRLIIRYFDFRISMDVSLLQEKSTFPVLNMRMSSHLEPFFFFLIYDCILHKCCAISNQYHFTNPISTFLPKFQGPSGPPVPPSGSAHGHYKKRRCFSAFLTIF